MKTRSHDFKLASLILEAKTSTAVIVNNASLIPQMLETAKMTEEAIKDLWLLLILIQPSVTQIIRCRYQEMQGDTLLLPAHSVFTQKRTILTHNYHATPQTISA